MRRLIYIPAVTSLVCLALATTALAQTPLLSQGRPAWASSAQSWHPSTHANDGQAVTSWAAVSRQLPEKWGVDLGASKSLASMTIQWSTPARFAYTISGSSDGYRYKALVAAQGSGLTRNTLSGTYRYVRVTVTGSPSSSRARIVEAEVFGTSLSAPVSSGSPSTPTPTPVPGTVSGPLNLNNAHDLVYDGVTFEGKGSGYGDASGLIFIQGASYNITFKNCIIGTNQDGVGNGVKIYDTGRGMHDINFINCTFKYQPRMSFECIGRSNPNEGGTGGKSFYNVNVINCTFEAAAGENISYDDNYSGTANRAGACTVSGNLCKGSGVGSGYQYGKVFENNGVHNMTVTGNTFYMGRDGCINLQGRDTGDWGFVFSNNIIDCRQVATGIVPDYTIAQPVVGENIYGGTFANNVVTNLKSWNVTYFVNTHNMDWRTTTWLGPNNVPYQTGSSGNQF